MGWRPECALPKDFMGEHPVADGNRGFFQTTSTDSESGCIVERKCQDSSALVNKVTTQQQASQNTDNDSQQDWCFFHRKFGKSARRCKAPCKHPSASPDSIINAVKSCLS